MSKEEARTLKDIKLTVEEIDFILEYLRNCFLGEISRNIKIELRRARIT